MDFRINYSQVVSQANHIHDLARNLNTNVSGLENLMQQMKSAWKGPAAEACLKQCELLKTEMNATFRQMEDVSSTIKQVADRIQREDEAAAERARRLSQGKIGGGGVFK
ncbi:WXG100 family type VII secretion target [Paenibacillus andongensis]|uniref:WXG100 family type VII secretion target n=1 Tax=Paenibacillus andongensis TaxID=2975482 RepID=UPI0021BB418E|nr:WXG100 family type VII secretion target [Paenibacillus andongensis]